MRKIPQIGERMEDSRGAVWEVTAIEKDQDGPAVTVRYELIIAAKFRTDS